MARWHQSAEDRERGAMTYIVGVLLLAIVAMGLVVYEVGAVVHERRQLQNGADAAVLAVAADCIEGTKITSADCATGFDADAMAKQYIHANADGRSLKELQWDPPGYPAQSVRVVAESVDEDGATFLPSVFNSVGWVREASAVARWGGIATAMTVPLGLPACVFDEVELGDSVYFEIKIGSQQEAGDRCEEGPAGQSAPGNFRWLEAGNTCEIDTETGDSTLPGVPGAGNPNIYGCDSADFQPGQILMVAVYTAVVGQGQVQYEIAGYAALEITNFKFHNAPGWTSYPGNGNCPASGNEVRCIEGKFVEFVERDAPIGENDFGVRSFALVG